jgi:hypothetical protein
MNKHKLICHYNYIIEIYYNDYTFFHPDFTVGTGIKPVLPKWLADYTADREFHPALKVTI